MIYGRSSNGQFTREFQSVTATPMSHVLESWVDPVSEPLVYARPPAPRPLPVVLAAVDADPELMDRFDLYYDYLVPARVARAA